MSQHRLDETASDNGRAWSGRLTHQRIPTESVVEVSGNDVFTVIELVSFDTHIGVAPNQRLPPGICLIVNPPTGPLLVKAPVDGG